LDWLASGCARAEEFGVDASRVINALGADDLISRTRG
jgi:hypothetical protein